MLGSSCHCSSVLLACAPAVLFALYGIRLKRERRSAGKTKQHLETQIDGRTKQQKKHSDRPKVWTAYAMPEDKAKDIDPEVGQGWSAEKQRMVLCRSKPPANQTKEPTLPEPHCTTTRTEMMQNYGE